MEKDFDTWNNLKKKIDEKQIGRTFNFHEGDIWWTSLGINVGAEINGKHENFERPVLVLKVINKQTMYVLPLTSKDHHIDRYHMKIKYSTEKEGIVVFSQMKVISSKRLLRKITSINKNEFEAVKYVFINLFLE